MSGPAHTLTGRLRTAEAMVCLTAARLLVALLPYRSWRRIFGPSGPGQPRTPTPADPHRAVRAVDVGRLVRRAAARLPFESVCLPRAMAARMMLWRRGIPGDIRFGARMRPGTGRLELHAWVMVGETCIVGDDERDGFLELSAATLPSDRSSA